MQRFPNLVQLMSQVNASSFPFLASLPDLTIALPGEDYIRWSRIVVNADGAYDPDTGEFFPAGRTPFPIQNSVRWSELFNSVYRPGWGNQADKTSNRLKEASTCASVPVHEDMTLMMSSPLACFPETC